MIPVGTNLRLKHLPWATLSLLALNWVIFLFHHRFDYEIEFWIWRTFFSIPGELRSWQLITPAFFHADIFHILFNSLFLLVFGPFVEDKVGWKDYLFLYFLTGVFAKLVHNTMTGLFLREEIFVPSLGASGAISGIMGVYLYRCYYSKIKLMVDLFLPVGIKLPAYIILPLWFVRDFIGGIDSIRGIHQNVAFWAHVGGFAAGFGASRYLQYEIQAKKEKLEFVAETSLKEYVGYGEGIQASEKLLEGDPENPQIHLNLARAKSRWRASKDGRIHYEKAIRLLLRVDPEKAADIFVECWGKYLTLLEPVLQVRLSLLLEKTSPDLSAITLQSLIDANPSRDLFMEEAYLHLARIYRRELGRTDLARHVYEKFLERFLESEKRDYVKNVLDEMEKAPK